MTSTWIKSAVLLSVLWVVLFLCSCAKTTVVEVQSPGTAEPMETNAPSRLDDIPDFSSGESMEMSVFSNGGHYAYDGRLYGNFLTEDGEYLSFGAAEDIESGVAPRARSLDSAAYATCITLHGDSVYYVRERTPEREFSLVRMDRDGGNMETLYAGEDCNYLQIRNGRLYFTDENNYFVSADLDGGDRQTVLDRPVFFPYFLDDGLLLYQDDGDGESLHLLDTFSGEDRKLTDRRSFSPVVAGSFVYYLTAAEGESRMHLCRTALDTRVTEVGNGEVTVFFTDGTLLYGANAVTAPLSQWESFSDGGADGLREECMFLCDDFRVSYSLDRLGDVKEIIIS